MLVSCDYAFLILCGAGGIPYSHTGEPLSVHSKDVDYDYLHWFFGCCCFFFFYCYSLNIQIKAPCKGLHTLPISQAQLFNYLIFLKGFW